MDILEQRLENQLLNGGMKTPYEVVKHMVCMQAQDFGQSKWAIASRVAGGCTLKDIEDAYNKGEIVRTRTQRGTIHAVATEDVPMMIELCTSKTWSGFHRRREWLGISDEIAEQALIIIEQTLKGGNKLTRKEMLAQLEKEGLELKTGRGYHLLCYAASRGLIVMGPMKGAEQALVLTHERIKKANPMDNKDGWLQELTYRYFASHGPATIADFAWWSGLGIGQIKKGIEMCGDVILSESRSPVGLTGVNKSEQLYYVKGSVVENAGTGPRLARNQNSCHFLAGFDEFLLGYKDRTATLELDHHTHVDASRNGIFKPTVMIGGRTVAIWGTDLKKKVATAWIKPFGKLTDSDYKILQRGIEEYEKYIEKKLVLSII